MPQAPTLESTLLQKATSIGPPQAPRREFWTMDEMPLPTFGKGLGAMTSHLTPKTMETLEKLPAVLKPGYRPSNEGAFSMLEELAKAKGISYLLHKAKNGIERQTGVTVPTTPSQLLEFIRSPK